MVTPGITGVVIHMDYQVLFNFAGGIILFLLGWALNSISTTQKDATKSLKELQDALAKVREEYVKRVDHDAAISRFEHRFDRIDDKLEAVLLNLSIPPANTRA